MLDDGSTVSIISADITNVQGCRAATQRARMGLLMRPNSCAKSKSWYELQRVKWTPTDVYFIGAQSPSQINLFETLVLMSKQDESLSYQEQLGTGYFWLFKHKSINSCFFSWYVDRYIASRCLGESLCLQRQNIKHLQVYGTLDVWDWFTYTWLVYGNHKLRFFRVKTKMKYNFVRFVIWPRLIYNNKRLPSSLKPLSHCNNYSHAFT